MISQKWVKWVTQNVKGFPVGGFRLSLELWKWVREVSLTFIDLIHRDAKTHIHFANCNSNRRSTEFLFAAMCHLRQGKRRMQEINARTKCLIRKSHNAFSVNSTKTCSLQDSILMIKFVILGNMRVWMKRWISCLKTWSYRRWVTNRA